MTMQPRDPADDSTPNPTPNPTQHPTQSIAPLAHPTDPGSPGSIGATEERRTLWGGDELPTYRKVAGYPATEPAPEPTRATGQLPVTGAPVTAPVTASPVVRPRGPHLPTVVRGVVILAMATIAVVWRMVDHPNWPIVGISVGIGVGVMFLLVAAVSAVLHHARDQHDFDRTLPGR